MRGGPGGGGDKGERVRVVNRGMFAIRDRDRGRRCVGCFAKRAQHRAVIDAKTKTKHSARALTHVDDAHARHRAAGIIADAHDKHVRPLPRAADRELRKHDAELYEVVVVVVFGSACVF